MKTTVTSDQIAKYQADGFLHVPGFLSPDEVATMKAAVVSTVADMGKSMLAGEDWKEGDDYYSKVFTQRLNLWKLNDTIKDYMFDPGLGKMITELAGTEGFRMWHDQALIKEPFGNPTAWHLDNPYWSFYSRDAISIWIALEDATPYNGCMYFVPGTQKLANFENSGIGQNLGDLFKIYPEMGKIDPVPVPMKAGDCSFHNGLTAHGAGANMTRGRRIAMTAGYMPIGSIYNGQTNVLPKSYSDTLTKGDVLENDAHNPVIYSKELAAV